MTDPALSLLSRGCGRFVSSNRDSYGLDGRLEVCFTPQVETHSEAVMSPRLTQIYDRIHATHSLSPDIVLSTNRITLSGGHMTLSCVCLKVVTCSLRLSRPSQRHSAHAEAHSCSTLRYLLKENNSVCSADL